MSRLAAREVTGVVLAGGQGRRMGGVDKGLVPFAGRPLVAHAAGCLRPHVGELVINANRHRDAYAEHADRVIADVEVISGTLDGHLQQPACRADAVGRIHPL